MSLSRPHERLLRRISTRRGREAEGVVLLEGPRVLATALDHGAELLFAVVDAGWRAAETHPVVDRITGAGIEVHEVEPEAFGVLAATESPQGILAVAREASPSPVPLGREERVLVLDGIQDPGNVGTLVRAAAALSANRVLTLDGTADPWSAKAVRASAGLVFMLPPTRLSWKSARERLAEARIPLIVADPRGTDVRAWLQAAPAVSAPPPSATPTPGPTSGWALAVGNEGGGPRQEVLDAASARVAIPLEHGVESMNVAMAGAILLWALGPGRRDGREAER